MERFLIVRSNRLNSFGEKLESDISHVENMFKELSTIKKMEKELRLFLHIRIPSSMYNPRLIKVQEDTIIIFDGHVRREFLEWIKKNNPGKRIVLWLWNTVEEIEHNFKIHDVPDGIEVWSYSEYDCKHFNLSYNTTFFWLRPQACCREICHDLFFVGKDKGRLRKIKQLKQICNANKIKGVFYVVATHKYSLPRIGYNKPLKYDKVQKLIAESKAILDIKVSKTAGPSLRALEAVFYNKKLVTDDIEVKKFKFYDPANIFILGENDFYDLAAFLEEPVRTVQEENIEYYSFSNWLRRF